MLRCVGTTSCPTARSANLLSYFFHMFKQSTKIQLTFQQEDSRQKSCSIRLGALADTSSSLP
ncbi:hypothetical protein [Candidatus Protochlamydia sp. W-9]|uniref:hypothetical protein n=1 Tax=Candidatus Protochlamydia sp. W-9 TaxID=1785087 RepID=UPI00117804E8|nr:hypothetical protein [Candidatus Protochlamydia sp. W-9]